MRLEDSKKVKKKKIFRKEFGRALSVESTASITYFPIFFMETTSYEGLNPVDLDLDTTIGFLEKTKKERDGMSFSVYDTAFVVASEILDPEDQQKLIGRINSQRQHDYTWGEGDYLPHSTVLNTLAVIWAYSRLGMEIDHADETAKSLDVAIKKCKYYPNHPTVAFEFVAPLMAKKIGTLNLNAESQEYLDLLYSSSRQKLDFIRAKLGFFNPSHTISFTSELALFLDDFSVEEASQVQRAKLANGSIGLSPAATAGAIILLKDKGLPEDPDLKDYLLNTLDDYKGEGFPGVHPYEHMKYLWYLLPWMMSGDIGQISNSEKGLDLLMEIYSGISHDKRGRVSWDPLNSGKNDPAGGLPDLDDTSLAFCLYLTILKSGRKPSDEMSVDALQGFRREDGSFYCYPLETHPSPVAIMHALKSIELGIELFGEEFKNKPEITDITESLLNHLSNSEVTNDHELELLCHDKWHSTWTYGFQRWLSIKPVVERYPDTVRSLVDFALRKEINGGWGQNEPTLEETAYVGSGLIKILALSEEGVIEIDESVKEKINSTVSRTREFMWKELNNGNKRPALWIAKTPYRPAWHESAIKALQTSLSSSKVSLSSAS